MKIFTLLLCLISAPLIFLESVQAQVHSVESLQDVEPEDWAYEALRSLIERYGLVFGYTDSTFRGDRSLSRYEFAALLSKVLERMEELVPTEIKPEDLTAVRALTQKFNRELATLKGQVDGLDARLGDLESTQFSTTTKLAGQVIMAANAGGFEGDRIIAPLGAVVSEDNPEATLIYRAVLFFNASFQGTDQLQIRLVTGSDGTDDNAGGLLEPNSGSNLDYTIQGRDSHSAS